MAKTPAVEPSLGDAASVEILIPGQVEPSLGDAAPVEILIPGKSDARKAVDDAAAEVKIGIHSATTGTKNVVSSATSAATKPVDMVSNEFEVASGELVNQVKTWIAEGNVRRLIIRTPDNKLVFEIPAMAGAVVGGLLIICAPILAVIGVIASIMSRVKVEVERAETPVPKV